MTVPVSGVHTVDEADFTPEEHALAERAASGWLPVDFTHAEVGALTSAERDIIAAALGEDDAPAEPLPVTLTAAERRGVAAVAEQTGTSEGDIVRQAVTEYLTRRATGSGHAA